MPETFPEYRARILGYLGDRDPLRVLRATPGRLEHLVDGLPTRLLRRRPAPEAWSVIEILSHLVDAELAFGWRIRNMLAASGISLGWWDQDVWAGSLGYRSREARRTLAWFRAFRESNLAVLGSVPRSRWRRCHGVHAVRGRQTVWEFVRQEAGHDLNHIRQIRRQLDRIENA